MLEKNSPFVVAVFGLLLLLISVQSMVFGSGTDNDHVEPLAAAAVNPGVVDVERDALMALYDSTDGPNWSNNTGWGVGEPCDMAWYGVSCDSGHVQGLDLYNNQLNGVIPAEFGDLSSLEVLYLHYNQLSGSIPAELENLNSLILLDLRNNQLSGSIPAELGNLGSLAQHDLQIDLQNNQLSGSIPAELENLNRLIYLNLTNNQLSGSIPAELIKSTSLRRLYLGSNQLSGSIPGELGDLRYLDLQSNQLSGSIPAELGNLLVELHLNNNQLSGLIPAGLSNLGNLEYLNLSGNPALVCWETEEALIWARGLGMYVGPDAVCPIAGPPTRLELFGPDSGLIDNTYHFTATTAPLTTTIPVTYVWQATGQSQVTHTVGLTDTAGFNWGISGAKHITVTVSNDFGAITNTLVITLYTPVQAAFVGQPVSGKAPLAVTFTNLSTGDYDGCLWELGDENTSADCDLASYVYTEPGEYSVALTVSGPGGTDKITRAGYIDVQDYGVYLPVVLKTET